MFSNRKRMITGEHVQYQWKKHRFFISEEAGAPILYAFFPLSVERTPKSNPTE